MITLEAGTRLPVSLCGRPFSAVELEQIQTLIEEDRCANRSQLAARACEVLGWKDCRGAPKLMSARVGLLRLDRGGWIELPPPRKGNGNGRAWSGECSAIEPPEPIGEVKEFELVRVEGAADSRQWNSLIQGYHYLGYSPMAGAQVRYWVRSQAEVLGALSFGAAAWKVAARDRWIGWPEPERQSHLHLLVNNARFLVLPWVKCPNLGSRILARCATQVPSDFARLYGYRPVLMETFVEAGRFMATVYRAANWQCVGQSIGRGKLDRNHQAALPVKMVWLYALAEQWRRQLGVER